MTLLEVGIALAIVGLMVMIAVPTISSVTRAQLRQKSGQLGGALRALYGQSASSGKSCRMVFDLDASAYWTECAKSSVRLESDGERSRNGQREKTRAEEDAERGLEASTEAEKQRAALAAQDAFTAEGGVDIGRVELGTTVRFTDVWVQHQSERYVAGKAFLYFWPTGLTEKAAIHLAQGDDAFTLLVSPLTGRVRIVGDKVDAPGEPQ